MSNNCDETKCSGDCSTCTGDGMTVTLTLDDDSTVECAIVGIFDAAEKDILHCFHWMKTVRTKTVKYICTAML